MRNIFLGILILLGLAFLLSCAPKLQSPEAIISTELSNKAKTEAKESWDVEWQRSLIQAKKEGKVVVYSSTGGDLASMLNKAVWEKFGFKVDVVSGRGSELTQKIIRERMAGLYLVDAYLSGFGTSLFYSLKPANALAPLEPFLLLPEVKDESLWWNGLGWIDDEKTALAFSAYISESLAINTDLVREGELKSFKDILNPKWKGKILMMDPGGGGSPVRFIGVIVELLGRDYLEALAKQEPVLVRDDRLLVEWLARGRFAIATTPTGEVFSQFKEIGAPIKYLRLEEVVQLTAGGGCIGVLNNRPDPGATKIFVNWLLSREGQLIFGKAKGVQSRRLDVSTDYLDPLVIRQPGLKYFDQTRREFVLREPEFRNIGLEVFAPLLR